MTIQSGAIFTIDTDTRFHKNAPAGGTGSLGSFTMTAVTGGQCLIDGTKVWLLKHTGGTGNVPALGSTVTGQSSGATGELMNISSAISATPTTAGSAMPATGYVKLKSKTGNFQNGENLQVSGSTFAVANGVGARGFIEVILDNSSSITVGRAQKFEVNGDWYESETTTDGNRGQQIQLPNYGGGSNTYYPGVWIETGSGTGEYEFWPAVLAGTGSPWSTSNLGTDSRSKFVQCLASGIIRIGSDGSNSIGHLPDSGCKIRIPNVLVWSCATASRASNSVPNSTIANRPDFTTTNAGQIDIENALGHWYLSFVQAYSVRLVNVAYFDQISITETATSIVCTGGGNGNYSHGDVNALILTSNFAGGTFTGCKFGRSGTIASGDYGTNVSYCNGFTFASCQFDNRTFRTNAAGHVAYFAYCNTLTFTGCSLVGAALVFVAVNGMTITDAVYADSFHTTSSSSTPPSGVIQFTSGCLNATVTGFGWFGSTANVHPDTCIVYVIGTSNVKIRNIGTKASPLSGGTSNAMLYFCNDGGNCFNVEIKRVYFDLIATVFYNGSNSSKGVGIYNCRPNDTSAKAHTASPLNQIVASLHASGMPTSGASVYGSSFYNIYTSSSAGRLGILFNESTAEYSSYITTSFSTSATGTSGFNSNGGLALLNLGDYAIFEFPFRIYGVDSFQNSAPTITTSTRMDVEYQIDTGSGWNGTWKTFNASNLSGESVSATTGFRFKIKCTANATNAANILTVVYCLTSADSSAQDVNYPLDLVPVTLTGLQTGTEVLVYASSTMTLLGGQSGITTGTSTTLVDSGSYPTVDITVLCLSYQNMRIKGVSLGTTGVSIPVSQVIDRQYLNPA